MGVLQKQPQAEVHLYERGQGPKHQFMVNLKGWEPNRIDVAGIMKAYNMKGLYAFSVVSGRGMELVPDKKNGLSRTTYSGKEGMIIRLDGEPQPSSYVKWNSTVMTLGATVFAFALLAGFVSMDSGRVDHMRRLKQEGPGWPLLLVGSLIVAIYVWRVWRASLMRWYK